MDDLISRETVRETLKKMYVPGLKWGTIDKIVDMMPSAQPEIIRCKDCKNWDTTWTNDFTPNYHYCPMVDGVRKSDFYCADAERRIDDEW